MWRERPVSHWADATGGKGLEGSFWKDVKARNWSELDKHVAGNYVSTMPGGRLDRAAALERFKHLQLADFSMGDMETELNGNTFVVTYSITLRGTMDDRPLPPDPVRMMTVWQEQKAGWMAIAHSESGPEK